MRRPKWEAEKSVSVCTIANCAIPWARAGGGPGGWAIAREGAGGGRGPKVPEGLFCHMNYGPVL